MNPPRYVIVEDTSACLVIRDVGPWHRHATVTNGAEEVVAELASRLRGRRLEYYDSEGNRDQLLVRDGKFAGFAPAGPARVEGEPLTHMGAPITRDEADRISRDGP